jgi:hypothetical protein
LVLVSAIILNSGGCFLMVAAVGAGEVTRLLITAVAAAMSKK